MTDRARCLDLQLQTLTESVRRKGGTMLLRLHPAATAEPCIQLRRFFRLMSGRVLALFQKREPRYRLFN